MMLESIRDKLFPPQPDSSVKVEDKDDFNRLAGAALLQKYQNDWMTLHRLNEENAKKSEEVDQMIEHVLSSYNKQTQMINELLVELGSLPSMSKDIKTAINKLGTLSESFRDLEVALNSLENITEIQQSQEKQLDQKFNLKLYEEKKRTEFEVFKYDLMKKHASKMNEFEAEQQIMLEERQKAFREAFEADVQHYLIHGQIERIVGARSSNDNLKLEDVELEQDGDSLDSFLAVEATEDTVSSP